MRIAVELCEDGRTGVLLRPLSVSLKGFSVSVPFGFMTDFASIPRIFWAILPPWGRYSLAAIVHDYLYAKQITTRKEADDVLLRIMKASRVSYVARYLIYYAVRIFGSIAWKRYQIRYPQKRPP